jgi:hypothetical protein
MNRKSILVCACAAITGLSAIGCANGDLKPAGNGVSAAAGQPAMQLPPGWTEADMKAAMEASTPGEKQALLAKDAGKWRGKSTIWMVPGAEPTTAENTAIDTVILDGRFLRTEWSGEMPGMGPFSGFGLKGYDNAAGKYVSTWIDSASTGIMNGTGEQSADGKAITWTFHYTCPVTKKPVVMRQIETWRSANSKTLEMWGQEPKSGREFKMMFIELTRK